eukprot:TRINITY_DN37006_c0_g1_i1.p1 TRINITY_DN37006_c0_g1~~TRINITY_DN37006_c0_g1_i1.p1  ORF type:complete len:277 (+),score=62.79 TRINITY_DN37006_c0_g1_i1:355-1185(+)
MIGPEGGQSRSRVDQGMIPQVVDEVFRRIASSQTEDPQLEFELRASYVEVWAGRVYDLLDESLVSRDASKALDLIQEQSDGTVRSTASEQCVNTTQALQCMLAQASRRRVTEANTMHEHSSRSHALLTLFLEKRWPRTEGSKKGYRSQTCRLHMVDLAGSESFQKASAQNSSINEGLLALGKVLTALADRSKHVPYRDSPLTRLLAGSLDNSHTTMLSCVNPAARMAACTLSTLRYSLDAMRISAQSLQAEYTLHVPTDPMDGDILTLVLTLTLHR